MYILYKLLFIIVSTDLITGLSSNEPNGCPRYVKQRMSNGQFQRVLQMSCCPDYMEVDNACIECPAGFYDQNCTSPCESGDYGPQCKQKCICTTARSCDRIYGCICRPGLTGPNCDIVCPKGKFGIKCLENCLCSVNYECNPSNGTCECYDGWLGKTCDEPCEPGTYGKSCMWKCLCSNTSECNPESGKCACNKGWTGIHCNHTCLPGKFGVDCLQDCACTTCNPETGTCLAGSQKGSAPTGAVIKSVVGILVLVVISLLLFIVFKHRQTANQEIKTAPTDEKSSNHYEDIEDYAEIGDVSILSPKQYSYAYTDDVKPPGKERQQTTKRKTNQNLSITDCERISKISNGKEEVKNQDGGLDDAYTSLLRDAKCASYQEMNLEIRVRMSSNDSNEWEPGYLKPTAILNDNEYTDAKSFAVYTNEKEEDTRTSIHDSDGSSVSFESGYLKPTASVKRDVDRHKESGSDGSSMSVESGYLKPTASVKGDVDRHKENNTEDK